MNWTDERVEQLCMLWGQGLSASKIAALMGGVTRNAVIGKVHRLKLAAREKSEGGVGVDAPRAKRSTSDHVPKVRPVSSSRTSISATVYSRSHANSGGGTVREYSAHSVGATALKSDYQPQKNSTALVARVLEFAPPLVAPESKNLILLELSENTCKWPIGDPMSHDFNFCGNNSNGGSPYCQFHSKLAYQSPADRRRKF
jgi:GcrA cell cycle regulator